MARPDGDHVDGARRSSKGGRRQSAGAARSPSSAGSNDWRATPETSHDSPPRPDRRADTVHRSDGRTPLLPEEARDDPPRERRSRASSRSRRHGSSSSSSAMPLTTRRASTRAGPDRGVGPAAEYRRGRYPPPPPPPAHPPAAAEHEDESRSGSRRSSRRDWSPPSGRRNRSSTTPDSSQSSRTSVTGGRGTDGESVATASTDDEDANSWHSRMSDNEARRLEPTPDAERRRRRRRRREAAAARESPIYEEDAEEEEERLEKDMQREKKTERRPSPDERKSPSRHSREKSLEKSPEKSPERPGSRASSVRKEHRHHRRSSVALETSRSSKSSKTPKRHHLSELVYLDRPSPRRSSTAGGSQTTSTVSSSTRRHSLLGGFFGSSSHAMAPERPVKPVKIVECIICMSDLPSTKAAKLKCGHRMCNSCLKRSFKLSVKDPQLMPPKCCTSDHIPLKHVDRLFDTSFKKTWNRKFAEFSTRNRLYCPSRHCGEWIKPENIHKEDGRRLGRCSRCRTKVCGLCNGKWHGSKSCPKDEATNKLLEKAKEEGWQRCFKCRTLVELKEGCNHMTCRCGAEFCMICGTKWKGCECPWFNYDSVEADRIAHMNIPIPIPMRGEGGPPSPRDFRGGAGAAARPRPRPQNYEEELMLRRLQEERDEALARRLQAFAGPVEEYNMGLGNIVGVGNAAGHFMNEDYRRRPHNVLHPHLVPPPPPPLAPPAFQRPHGVAADYVAGVNRERGVRESSMDRELVDRLADRFSERRHGSSHGGGSGAMPSSPVAAANPHASAPPPPAPLPAVPMLRVHSAEAEMYNNARTTRPSERVVAGRRRHDYVEEAAMHAPASRRPHVHGHHHGHRESRGQHHHRETATRTTPPPTTSTAMEEPKMSTLAGLTGPGSGMNRVFEWRDYVEPGIPVDDGTKAAEKKPAAAVQVEARSPPAMRRPRGVFV